MNFEDKILNYAKASYPVLVINTHEEKRVNNDLFNILKNREDFGKFYFWDCINGLECRNDDKFESPKGLDDPVKLFEFLLNAGQRNEKRSAYVLRDFHLELESKTKAKDYIRYVRHLSNYLRRDSNLLIFVSPFFTIPIEWEKEVQVVEYSLPDAKAIKNKLNDIVISINKAKKAKGKEDSKLSDDFAESIIEASKGMTVGEVDAALALASVSTKGEFNDEYVEIVFNEKITQIKKNSLLTYVDTDISFDQVGGLQGIKSWINLRKKAFSKEAKEYGLPTPKGLLLAGISGGGKSYISKAIAREFKAPLFQLDIGKLFSKHVGESESNIRSVIKTLESIGKCVVLIDEIEKSLNVSAVAGTGDSGTSSRMFATLLTWLSDRTSPVFIISTSNNHLILPPELVRPGRFDAAFWVDLPTMEERKDIFEVVIKKYKRDPKKFDTKKLAKQTENFTGAEIEELFKASLFRAFSHSRELLDSDIIYEFSKFKPHASMFPDQLAAMRAAAKGKLKIAGKDGEITDDIEASLRTIDI